MTGELIALASATLYALSGVAIARGAGECRTGDNGAFLSIVLTTGMVLVLWAVTGGPAELVTVPGDTLPTALGYLVAAGVASTVLGRLSMFKSVELGGAVRASAMRRLTPVLAALLSLAMLSEVPGGHALAGMALILGGTALLRPGRGASIARPGWVFWGAWSATSYGMAYVLRKMAMQHMASAVFGALVGAATGLAWYLLAAPFSARARKAILGVFRCGRWQVIAATTMALAQIGQFLALARTDVATVAVIGSAETAFSLLLAVVVFRTEPLPGRSVLAGAALSTLGVVLMVLGR